MPKLLMLRGLPGSGKTTYARDLVEKMGYVRVNKDELRKMLNNGQHSQSKEEMVLEIRDLIVINALKAGKNVVVDDTNIHPKHEKQLAQIAFDLSKTKKVSFKVFDDFLKTPVEQCIENDLKRFDSVGEQVIRKMHREAMRHYPDLFLKQEQAAYPRDNTLLDCVLVDLDGTLALMKDRNPYDASTCENDEVNQAVAKVIRGVAMEHKVFFMSGRSDKYREQTERWLANNAIMFGPVYMRKEGDVRKDSIVKKELFDAHIRGKYNVSFVMDDRQQVVDMWREIGLVCFQVAEGNF